MVAPVVIVMGASAGGVEALSQVVADFPADLPAAVVVVLHMPARATSVLPRILSRAGPLPVTHAVDREPLRASHVFVARPDYHLIVDPGLLRLSHGPRENGHRPAIDITLRSAARAYGRRAIGVVLTGSLDDGALGLRVIKQHGGLALVQDPAEALYADMPRNAIGHAEVDAVLPLTEMGPRLAVLAQALAAEQGTFPVPQETNEPNPSTAEAVAEDKAELERGGRPGETTMYACPDCGGVLWEFEEGGLIQFRCHVGHAYSMESFLARQSEELESALWSGVRALEEKASISRRMAQHARERGTPGVEALYAEQARDAERRANLVRRALLRTTPATDEAEAPKPPVSA